MERTPEKIRKLNELLRADLGSNPRYAWRWSDNLLHVMDVVDEQGKPVLTERTSPGGVIYMEPQTMTRQLLPFHEHCWVLCALIETTAKDGALEGTGIGSWVPVSGPQGPVTLYPFETPNLESTQYVVDCIRQSRAKTATEMGQEWSADMARKEKDMWNRKYDQIRDAATAYYSIPGKKAHVSYAYGDPT